MNSNDSEEEEKSFDDVTGSAFQATQGRTMKVVTRIFLSAFYFSIII